MFAANRSLYVACRPHAYFVDKHSADIIHGSAHRIHYGLLDISLVALLMPILKKACTGGTARHESRHDVKRRAWRSSELAVRQKACNGSPTVWAYEKLGGFELNNLRLPRYIVGKVRVLVKGQRQRNLTQTRSRSRPSFNPKTSCYIPITASAPRSFSSTVSHFFDDALQILSHSSFSFLWTELWRRRLLQSIDTVSSVPDMCVLLFIKCYLMFIFIVLSSSNFLGNNIVVSSTLTGRL